MTELLIILFVGFILLALVTGVVILPLIAFIRTQRIVQLQARLERLEHEMQELRQGRETRAEPRAEVAPATSPEPAEAGTPTGGVPREPDSELPEVLPAGGPVPAGTLAATPAPAAPPLQPAFDLEDWIGRRGLGWVAVILLLFATAFFLKYAFENAWVGELGRVAIGVGAGIALCIAGHRYHRGGWRIFSQMLTAAGVVLLYLSTFASFGYYHLLPRDQAAIFLVALMAETAALAVLYEAPAIAIMALIGGLLNPVLLASDHDQFRNLFTYLVLLDIAAIGIVSLRPSWPALTSVALAGSQVLFWGWYARWYHPEKLHAAITFQAVVFALFFVHGLIAHVFRRRAATLEDLGRLVVNPFLFAVALFVLLQEDYHVWLGSMSVALAAIFTALGVIVIRRRPEDERQLLVVIAVAMGFVTAAFPLQQNGPWVSVGWAVQAAALVAFGLRVRSTGLRGMGAVLLFLAVGRLLFVDTPDYMITARNDGALPFMHPHGMSALAVVMCIWAIVLVGWRLWDRLATPDRMLVTLCAVLGIGLLWLYLSLETYRFIDYLYGGSSAQMALSAVWAAYAVVLLAAGFRAGNAVLRWAALGLFMLTLAKVFLLDMAQLPGFYRVAAFFALSVMMGIAAWGYQRFQLGRVVRGTDHDAT
jgi:uncharacterized membrane protein